MKKTLLAAVTASVLLASSLQAQIITGYNITNARLSGFGGWQHTYTGTMTLNGNGLYDYAGGSGTMNDGLFGLNHINNQLFLGSDNTVITLFLDNYYTLANLNLYGGDGSANYIPGTLTGATITFGSASAAITSSPFNVSGSCLSGPCDDAFSFGSTALAGQTGNMITISNVQPGYGDYFNIAEIDVQGRVVTSTPEPASLALVATGLGLIGIGRRRNRKSAA